MFVINKSLTSKITEIECQEIESKNDQFKKMRKQRGKIKSGTNRKYKMYYDYSKRTNGGFLDAMFLCGMILSASVLIFLSLLGGK